MPKPPPQIFARNRVAAKFARAQFRQSRPDCATFLSEAIAQDMTERLAFMQFAANSALIVGDSTDTVPHALSKDETNISIGVLGVFDEETPGPAQGFDLIVHLLGLGMVNDLLGALIHARNALRDSGLFLAAFPGAGSLPTLREIALEADGEQPASRTHPLVDNRAGTALLERALFKRQVVDSYPINVRYSSLRQLVEDLRDHGLNSSLASPTPPLTREWWGRAQNAFDALREADGKVTETFEILTLTAWR